MIRLLRTDSQDQDFIRLVRDLDVYLADLDGEDHAFYHQLNKTGSLRFVVVAYDDGEPVGCGAIREYVPGTMEIKRMYVVPEKRRKRIAARIVVELENWARELGCTKCILETGKRQPEAIRLYEKSGYRLTANFGQYEGVENSRCFLKKLTE